jgi:CheY-like chemotaxis protein
MVFVAEGKDMSAFDPSAGAAAPAPAKLRRVLVVDDDIIISMNTAALLEELGYVAIETNSGAEALDVLAQNPDIDLLVTDQAMPEMRGTALIAEARRRNPALRTILATGYDDAPDDRPVNVHRLSKPFGITELEAAVDAALARDIFG